MVPKVPKPAANVRPSRASADASTVKRCSGTRKREASVRNQYASDVLSVKNSFSAEEVWPPRFRNERFATSMPVLQLQRPLITERNSAPAAMRRIFKSLSGTPAPKKVFVRFQFSLRASTYVSKRVAGSLNNGVETAAK